MAENCWVLTNEHGVDLAAAVGVEGVPHFENEKRATEVAADYPSYTPRHLTETCTILTCSCCEVECGEEEEGYTLHFFSASEFPENFGWARDGDTWRCETCATGGCDCESPQAPAGAAQAEQERAR